MALIQITADLHADTAAMERLLADADGYALTLVAGDLMDMFALRGGLDRQRAVLHDWMAAMVKGGRWLGWCDGNHDHELRGPDSDRIIGPSESRLVDGLAVVTCLPWEAGLWSAQHMGEPRQRSEQANVPWIVVSHRPPPSSALGDGDFTHGGHVECFLSAYAPDYYVCGHLHEIPYEHGHYADAMGSTTILNPGRSSEGINTILLNPGNGAMVWDG